MKKGNELVKVAVNVISPLADPRAAALQLQAITWPRTRAACLSSLLPCLAFTDRGEKKGKKKKYEKSFFVKKKKEKERENCTHRVTP